MTTATNGLTKKDYKRVHRIEYWSLAILLLIYASAFIFLSFRNHELYQTFGWDLGFFDQLLWQASRGHLNFVSTIGNINILGDHFQPLLYLLVPLYWVWNDVKVLLLSQVILVSAAAIPIYLLARDRLRSPIISFALSFSYLLYRGTQFTITNEFHQSAFIPLLLSLGLYWLETGKRNLGILAILSLLLVKEEMGLLVAALGIIFLIKDWKGPALLRKAGPLLILAGVLSFFLLVKIVIPVVSSRGRYIHYGYGSLGQTPTEVTSSIINNPVTGLKTLIEPRIKLKQVGASVISFGGLPLLSPVNLIPVFQNYAVRFLDDRNIHRWLDNNHYSAPLGPLLAFATISGIQTFQKHFRFREKRAIWIGIFVLFSAVGTNFFVHGPINSIIKSQLYFTPQWVKDDNALVEQIPEGVSIAATNSLVPHLSHRDNIYLLPEIRDAEFIAIDLANGPNKYSPMLYAQMNPFLDQLMKEGWCKRKQYNQAIVLERCI